MGFLQGVKQETSVQHNLCHWQQMRNGNKGNKGNRNKMQENPVKQNKTMKQNILGYLTVNLFIEKVETRCCISIMLMRT